MEAHLKIIGILLILLSLVHLIFPKKFSWDKELQSLSLINKQMMIVHTFFIALVVFLIGVFCVTCSDEIIKTNLGHKISFGLFIFWDIRLIVQLFVYSNKLWKGKRFETVVHIVFSFFWLYMTVVFFIIYQLPNE